MQFGEEQFNDTVKSLTPDKRNQDKPAIYSFRHIPARAQSEKKKMAKQTSLFGASKQSASDVAAQDGTRRVHPENEKQNQMSSNMQSTSSLDANIAAAQQTANQNADQVAKQSRK